MRNFRELTVWKDGRILVKEVYKLTHLLPDSERFGLIPQVQRGAISIPANIAEGCGKDSEKDFILFLQISLGSPTNWKHTLFYVKTWNFFLPK